MSSSIDFQQPQSSTSERNSLHSHTRNAYNMIATGGLGHEHNKDSFETVSQDVEEAIEAYEEDFLPGESRSLSGIAMRANLLGVVFTASLILSLNILLYTSLPAWRVPLFLAVVSLFHFLEFWSTAAFNTSNASVSSFLLSANGTPYTVAMIGAFCECLITSLFFPISLFPPIISQAITLLGLAFIVLGQTIRTLAIITAGRSFNHIVQHTKRKSHILIDFGIFAYLRHPSYFGYFWWGLGTQMMMGNGVCFVLYAAMLWKFFASRIPGEEKGLTRFFGDDYVKYRARTRVGIPFIK